MYAHCTRLFSEYFLETETTYRTAVSPQSYVLESLRAEREARSEVLS